jgi:hypothetical protein
MKSSDPGRRAPRLLSGPLTRTASIPENRRLEQAGTRLRKTVTIQFNFEWDPAKAKAVMVVVHTFRELSSKGEATVRIISARRATRRELKDYEANL